MEKKRINGALFIKRKRESHCKNDNLELQEKRKKFLEFLLVQENVEVLEMYLNGKETIYSKKSVPQYFNKIKFCNTRTQIRQEITLEPKDDLGLDKAILIMCDLCSELIKKNIHFAVFYAEGQRSPHLRVYDFEELNQLDTSYARMKARLKFLRWILPFRVNLFDLALLDDSHYIPLEFAPHWKYGTIFNLIYEYIPNKKEEKNAASS